MNFRSSTSGSKIGGTNPSSRLRSPCTSSPAGGSTATTCTAGLLLLQVPADAHQRAARAEAGDEHVDLGAVAPDLGPGALVVRERVRGVAVLEQAARSDGSSARELLGQADRAVAPLVAGRQHDLGAEDLEQLAALDRHVLGHHDAQRVAAQLRDQREADAGVARRRLEDRVARRAARRLPRPARSSSSAMRSFDEPPGFWPSSLAKIRTSGFGDSACTPTSGVSPMSPRMFVVAHDGRRDRRDRLSRRRRPAGSR